MISCSVCFSQVLDFVYILSKSVKEFDLKKYKGARREEIPRRGVTVKINK